MNFPKKLLIGVPSYLSKFGNLTYMPFKAFWIIKTFCEKFRIPYEIRPQDYYWDNFIEQDLYGCDMVLKEVDLNRHTTSYPFKIGDYTFVIEKPGYAMNTFAFLKPFGVNVWLSLVLSVLATSFFCFLIFNRTVPLRSAFFYILGSLFGEHHDWRPKSAARKLIIFIWSLCIMFLTLSYGSVLLSFLTVRIREKGVANFGELYRSVRDGKVRVGNLDWAAFDKLITSENKQIRYIGEHIEDSSHRGADLKMVNKHSALLGSRTVLEQTFGGGKHLISDDSYFSVLFYIGYSPSKKFCCKKEMDEIIHKITAAGLMEKYTKDNAFRFHIRCSFFPTLKHFYLPPDQVVRPLSLSDMLGAFYVFFFGHLLAILYLSMELLAKLLKRN